MEYQQEIILPGSSPHLLLTNIRILGVARSCLAGELLVLDQHWNIVADIHCGVARNNWIQNLLVEGPDLVPLHVVHTATGALQLYVLI